MSPVARSWFTVPCGAVVVLVAAACSRTTAGTAVASPSATAAAPAVSLPGRTEAIAVPDRHTVLGTPLQGALQPGHEEAFFGMGCFWGAERKFWQTQGVVSTAAGYAAGATPHPTYEEVCSGDTGHNEVVRVVYDPKKLTFDALLRVFWESHDPTQGNRQGNDVGAQYRSGIYVTTPAQRAAADRSKVAYGKALADAGHEGAITTEILPAPTFYYAEAYHQQYLDKNPDGYCGLGGTGVTCPVGLTPAPL